MIKITVPATSANLGIGYDTLGMAVGLYSHFTFERADKLTRSKLGFSILGLVRDNPKELTANGVECIQQPTTYEFGSRAAYFLDYEKNIWEVFAWKEGNGPGLLDQ